MHRTLYVAGMAAALLYVPAPVGAADDGRPIPAPLRAADDGDPILLAARGGGLFRNRRPLFGRKDEKDKKPKGPGPPRA